MHGVGVHLVWPCRGSTMEIQPRMATAIERHFALLILLPPGLHLPGRTEAAGMVPPWSLLPPRTCGERDYLYIDGGSGCAPGVRRVCARGGGGRGAAVRPHMVFD